MKTKVNDLTDQQLDELCARAQGWETRTLNGEESWREHGTTYIYKKAYHPTANDAQATGLVKEFRISLVHGSLFDEDGVWAAGSPTMAQLTHVKDSCLNRAICKAVVASVFGDEVEV